MGHIHARSMMEYAKDAAETDTPWERWESSYKGGKFETLDHNPNWSVRFDYRRKPKVILINGHEVPEPVRVQLNDGEVYWTISIVGGSTSSLWQGDVIDFGCLENGFIHLTREAAEKHFNALKSFTAKGEQ